MLSGTRVRPEWFPLIRQVLISKLDMNAKLDVEEPLMIERKPLGAHGYRKRNQRLEAAAGIGSEDETAGKTKKRKVFLWPKIRI